MDYIDDHRNLIDIYILQESQIPFVIATHQPSWPLDDEANRKSTLNSENFNG